MIQLILSIATLVLLLLLVILFLVKKQDLKPSVKEKIDSTELNTSKIDPLIRSEFVGNRQEQQASFNQNRMEINNLFQGFSQTINQTIEHLSSAQNKQFEFFSTQLLNFSKSVDERMSSLQVQLQKETKENRTEQNQSLAAFEKSFTENVNQFNNLQKQKFDDLVNRQEAIKQETSENLKEMRETVELRLQKIQEDNNKQLDEMRKTVDEKLQSTVERRFNESFKLISTQLEQVQKGLGEMQNLASGVGDLKKVLTNVKTRGNLGEIQLEAILDQILSPDQYDKNAQVKKSSQERVEFAIKLPGVDKSRDFIYLPIDSKFPIEDYNRLIEIYESADSLSSREVEVVAKQFETAVKRNAKDIYDKYINPPNTTDFAIMFVPTEGLYAEILRRTGLFETLQRDYRVTVVGPTNLVAFLSSLQMGFRTLAIEKRSSEVWEILSGVKTEFGRFGDVLEKTKKKLQEASNVIDQAGVRSRAIERKLRNVEELPLSNSDNQINITLLDDIIEDN